MKCPHCMVEIHAEWLTRYKDDGGDVDNHRFAVRSVTCPACRRDVFEFSRQRRTQDAQWVFRLIYPPTTNRPLPPEVPEPYATDFREAVDVLPASAKASAALSRRNLQALIHTEAKIVKKTLAHEIEALIATPGYPSHLASNIDAIRNIGNFAAHPLKDTNTGEIIEVEPQEAEWLLDVLEEMFDYYFVQPKKSLARRAAIDAKLAQAGKPPMK